jgi:glutaminyl-peptide cyclotransferase
VIVFRPSRALRALVLFRPLRAAGALACAGIIACTGDAGHADTAKPAVLPAADSVPAGTRTFALEVVRSMPHDPEAFTQGLVYDAGAFYESTGLEGKSSVRKVDAESGIVLQEKKLDKRYFGEGLALLRGELFQLTWKSGTAFVYDTTRFAVRRTFRYLGEGWGLTSDGTSLIMSDGTSRLRVLDPATGAVRRTVNVTDGGVPVDKLNELEYVKGKVLANIWQTNQIASIDPGSGTVVAWIDAAGLLTSAERREDVDVLNGIAFDAEGDRLFVTGKLWPRVFEVRLRPR